MFLHVVSDELGALLVKATQQDGADHDRHIQPDASQEARALQGHIGRPDAQGFARAVVQGEEVVTENASQKTRQGKSIQKHKIKHREKVVTGEKRSSLKMHHGKHVRENRYKNIKHT